MAANSAQEQLMLELVNRARMDPAAEAARFGIGLGGISATPKQVLAMNDRLVIAADKHSNWMLVNDQFSHEEPSSFPSRRTGFSPSDRMTAAGYSPITSAGENISFVGSSAAINATTAIIDQHEDLFRSTGHRANILSNSFREIGLGQQIGSFTSDGSTFNASMVTQNFGLSGNKVFVTGVVYNDTVVNDNFFSVGEQTAGRVVSVPGVGDTTGAGGGYELGLTSGGAKVVSFNLSSGLVQMSVTVGTRNIKIDLVNGHEVWTNTDLAVVAGPITELHALGIEGVDLAGGAAGERLTGNKGANVLDGGGGNDVLDGGTGSDLMRGRDGNDVYRIDTPGDIVDESTGSGADTVQSTVSVKLTDAAHVRGTFESVSLTGTASALAWGNDFANILTGNAGSNSIAGLAGNDVLNGGAGRDTMVGGAGQDFFVFNAPLSDGNADTVTDFNPADDIVRLENAVMVSLGAATGGLNPALFWAGVAAHDRDDRIVYNPATGELRYDGNGTNPGAVTHLATLTSKPTLAAADFVVI
jgi:serralysin